MEYTSVIIFITCTGIEKYIILGPEIQYKGKHCRQTLVIISY